MIVCHICLSGPFTEGLSYQENLLPKYHTKQGHSVFQIVTCQEWKNTSIIDTNPVRYKNSDGVEVIRLKARKGLIGGRRFDRYPYLYRVLLEINPDIVFVHDIQFLDASVVAKYLKRHSNCIAFADNHCDYVNGMKSWASRKILHGLIWRHAAHKLEPYVKKFYGVLPARVDVLVDVYHLPKEKCELLVMGADDDLVQRARSPVVRCNIRHKYCIASDTFLVVSGGKINHSRPETLNLMKAFQGIRNLNIRLLLFGAVSDDLKKEFDDIMIGNECVTYIGWIDSVEMYSVFSAADLVVFPGLHSVMWEQAVATGVPCLFRNIDGYHHVDLGGNAMFLDDVSPDGLCKAVIAIATNKNLYTKMRKVAEEKGKVYFSYDRIAQRCIEG